jgi:signal transduction histidine kinase
MQKETKLLNLDKNNIIQVLDNVIQNKNDADEIIM